MGRGRGKKETKEKEGNSLQKKWYSHCKCRAAGLTVKWWDLNTVCNPAPRLMQLGFGASPASVWRQYCDPVIGNAPHTHRGHPGGQKSRETAEAEAGALAEPLPACTMPLKVSPPQQSPQGSRLQPGNATEAPEGFSEVPVLCFPPHT